MTSLTKLTIKMPRYRSIDRDLEFKMPKSSSIKHRLWIIVCAPLVAQLIGSAFNIWYNFTHIQPLLTPAQFAVFLNTVKVFNAIVYPAAVGLWIWAVLPLWQPCQQLQHNQPVEPERLLRARRRVINLPWWVVTVGGICWLLCIPVFLLALLIAPGRLNPHVLLDLPISFVISALIAITHSFFVIEISTQRLLYPVLFREARPAETPGAFPLSLRERGLLYAFCAGVCPITSLLLLCLAPHSCETQDSEFAMAVGGLGIAFGLSIAWMLGQLVVEPVEELKRAAIAVAEGNLNVRLQLQRADELGLLMDEFNHMIGELQEKQRLQETFGRHVGEQVAVQILQRDPRLSGIEQEVTVLFADLRNFTTRSSTEAPQQIVALLNLFLTEMVEIVEQRHGGMVNKFLGDGFMALFGVGEESGEHAAQAVAAGQDMLRSLKMINDYLESQGQSPLAMGIGIHTGKAVVGCIGSNRRLEYTAIGDTVNVASRVESLTKQVGEALLMTAATRQAIPATIPTELLPPQWVKGKSQPLSVYRIPSSH
jgi:adenylate cyclase